MFACARAREIAYRIDPRTDARLIVTNLAVADLLVPQLHNYQTLVEAIDGLKGDHSSGYCYVRDDGTEMFQSYAEARLEALKRSAFFRHRGIKPGTRIGMVVPKSEDFVPAFLGALWAGLVPVPMYPPLAMGKLDVYLQTLQAVLEKAKVECVVIDERLSPVLWSSLARVPSINAVIKVDALRELEPAPEEPPATIQSTDTAFLQFTSGSTALPKGVALTHANIIANISGGVESGYRVRPGYDSCVSWLPLYHDMGLIGFVLAPLIYRMTVTLIPTMSFIRRPSIWIEQMHDKKATITFAPNFAYSLVVKRTSPAQRAAWDLSKMRHFGCGAEPINPVTMRAFLEAFAPSGVKPSSILSAYGMAEHTVAISFIDANEEFATDLIEIDAYEQTGDARIASTETDRVLEFACVGKAFPEHEVAVFGDGDQRLPDRRVGELRLRGPSVAAGYIDDPVATEATFGGGWLRTGDLGYLVDGRIFVTGRKKDIIIVNGRKYNPQRIEWVTDDIPGVRKGSSVAFSRPGEATEELVVVVESNTEDAAQLEKAVRAAVSENFQLAVADIAICVPGALPKTSSGKQQRAKTRALYLKGTLGQHGNRTVGARADALILARHVALSWVGRARYGARQILRRFSPNDSVGPS